MITQESLFELAPAGIIRVAAWSIESLDNFGDRELARLALEATSSNDYTWNQYIATYQRVLDHEREILWQRTAEDSRFMKALLLSNPLVSSRVRHLAPKRLQARTKSIRRLETTLYRYLARAAGRTTPNGLWAGVGLVEFTETVRNVPAAARYSFSPDLRPFQTILGALARRPTYREGASLRVNPTLVRQSDGSWRFWARTRDGRVERREVQQEELVDTVLEQLVRLGCGTFEELARTVEASESSRRSRTFVGRRWGVRKVLRDMLNVLVDEGVLFGGLALPNQFATPWQALSLVEDGLDSNDRRAWNHTVSELRCLCDNLSAGIEAMTLDALEDYLLQARRCVDELARTLGVALDELPNPILRCDLGLPFQINLSGAQRGNLLKTLEAYECCWIKGMSPATAFRGAKREQLEREFERSIALGDIESNIVSKAKSSVRPTWAQLAASGDPEVITRLEQWEKRLLRDEPEVVLDSYSNTLAASVPAAPFGCLYVGLFEAFQLVVHGIGDDPARAFARFSGLFDSNHPLHIWLQERLDHLALQHRITIAELQGPFEKNPNVLARCKFSNLPIELWGASAGTVSLLGAKISIDPLARLPFLKLPSMPEPVAVFWFSSADVSTDDPISERLLYTTFQESPAANFRASALPVQAELDTPRFSPRIRLPGGAIMRSRRTVLSGSLLEDLAQASAIERYARWQQLATEHGWPTLLSIQIDSESPLPMHRDSPLALESLFKGLQENTRWLIVEELVSTPWLVGSDGGHYMAELALPFARTEHSWSLLDRRAHLGHP